MSNIIHSQKINNIKPIIWYGKSVYGKYKQIIQILNREIGDNIEYFLLEPEISTEALEGEENALWSSEKYTRLKPLSTFSEKIQKKLKLKLKTKIDKILLLANRLKNSESEDEKEFAEFLELVVEVPGLDYVYSNGKDVVLVCWGFKSVEIENRDFKLSKAVDNSEDEKLISTENNKNINNDDTNKKDINSEDKKPKTKSFKKYLLILSVVLISGLIAELVYHFKDDLFGYKQDVKPIDPTKVKIDKSDPMKRKIIVNRLTVILDIDNGVTNEKFKKIFNSKFPNSDIKIVYEEPLIGLLELEIPENEKEKWIKDLEKFKEVVTTNIETIISSSYMPNDKGFTESKKKWLFEITNTYKGWDKTKGDKDIVIAVIDGAFDLEHPELKGKKIIKSWNAATGTSKLSKATPSGYLHGTHVAATATGNIDNNLGTGGICPECTLMPIQVGQENVEGFSSNTILRAILYAIKNDADVINLSIGTVYDIDFSKLSDRDKKDMSNSIRRKTIKEEIKYERVFKLARKKNIAIVYAAGNDNMYSDVDPQKRSADIIVVGAVTNETNKSSFSNYGENVTISAPGTQIYSAAPNKQYKYLDGTSMASPIVAGLIGLIKSKNPTLPNDRIHEILINTGKKINNQNKAKIGPLIQVDKALKEATKSYSCKDEVKRLKEELKKCKNKNVKVPKKKKMIIPKKRPKNFEFAEGSWKSNEELLSVNDPSNKVVLYFDISKTGKGNITLKLSKNNEECKAKISLSFSGNTLNINQLEKAICNKSSTKYSPYYFTCIAAENNVAQCKAKGNTEFTFELIKQ